MMREPTSKLILLTRGADFYNQPHENPRLMEFLRLSNRKTEGVHHTGPIFLSTRLVGVDRVYVFLEYSRT